MKKKLLTEDIRVLKKNNPPDSGMIGPIRCQALNVCKLSRWILCEREIKKWSDMRVDVPIHCYLVLV